MTTREYQFLPQIPPNWDLSTVVDSDMIIFMDKGKIIDQGTHQELLNKNKVYQKLYQKELK